MDTETMAMEAIVSGPQRGRVWKPTRNSGLHCTGLDAVIETTGNWVLGLEASRSLLTAKRWMMKQAGLDRGS